MHYSCYLIIIKTNFYKSAYLDFLNGDINLDHTVNIQDVLALINLILLNESGYNADINDDGILNVLDVIELVGIILNN